MREFRMLFAGLFAALLVLESILLGIALRERSLQEAAIGDQRLLLQAREAIENELEGIIQLSERALKAATTGDHDIAASHEDLLASVVKRTSTTAPKFSSTDVAARLQGLKNSDTFFRSEDFTALQQALTNAKILLQSDRRALHALRGLFPDAEGNFTIRGESDPSLSLVLPTDELTVHMRESVRTSLSDFLAALDVRIHALVKDNAAAFGRYSGILSLMIVILLVSTAAAGLMLYRNISEPLKSFIIHSRKINDDLARTFAQLEAVSAERDALRGGAQGPPEAAERPASAETLHRIP